MSYDIIKKYEGLRLEAYMPTPNDRWTIGWGHTKTARPGMKITLEQAELLFESDILWVEQTIEDLVKVDLNINQYEAVASLIYNIGRGAFSKSTLLRKINAGDHDGAADEFLRWVYQKGVKLNGLVRRREEERSLYLTPTEVRKGSESFLQRLLGLFKW